MITVTTETGSIYEVDEVDKKIRRLIGMHPPTPRQGDDGEWKPYDAMTIIAVGIPFTIIWHDIEATITSNVTSVITP